MRVLVIGFSASSMTTTTSAALITTTRSGPQTGTCVRTVLNQANEKGLRPMVAAREVQCSKLVRCFTGGPSFNLSPDLSAAELLGVDIDIGTTLLDGQHESVQGLSRQRPGEVVRRYDAFTQDASEGAGL